MTTTTRTAGNLAKTPTAATAPGGRQTTGRRQRPNLAGGLGGFVWLAVIILPIYYIVITSLRTQAGFFAGNPLAIPTSPTLDNYRLVLENDFARYFLNSVI